jgi:energy-coupling factor transporter ATP-binding protein EcfA2
MGFSNHDKQILAKRAGYHCSICNVLTIGPSEDGDKKVVTTGDAAHIVGEKPTSKRHNAKWNEEQLNHIDNGIWLCALHHRKIDGDETQHSVTQLKEIKKNHLKRVTLLQDGIVTNNGLVINLKVSNIGPLDKAEFDFGNITLIKGSNGSGKTLICELLASMSNPKYLQRWQDKDSDLGNSEFEINYFHTKEMILRTIIDRAGNLTSFIDNREVPQHISPIKCIYLYKAFKAPKGFRKDIFIKHLAEYFNLNSAQFYQLIGLIGKSKKVFCNDIYFTETNEFMVKMSPKQHDFSYNQLSSGEQQRVILEIALRLSDFYSLYRPTLLIIERNAVDIIDDTGISKLLNELKELAPNYQFIFTAHNLPDNLDLEKFQYLNLSTKSK